MLYVQCNKKCCTYHVSHNDKILEERGVSEGKKILFSFGGENNGRKL